MWIIAALVGYSPARAAFVFVTDQSNYNADSGQNVVVSVYLRETDTTVLVDEDGIFGADVQLSRSAGDSVIVDMLGNTAEFDFHISYEPAKPLPPAGATEAGFAMSTLAVVGPGAFGGDVFLGTFTILTGPTVGVSTFSVRDLGPETYTNTITNHGTVLDHLISAGSFTITVGTVVAAWAVDDHGNWSDGSNWTTVAAPVGIGAAALLGPVATQPLNVTLDVPVTLGTLTFDSAFSYAVGGAQPLTLENTSGAAAISVLAGSHTITAPATLASDTVMNVSDVGDTLTISNLTAAGINLTKSGAGSLRINAVSATGLSIDGGSVKLLDGTGHSTVGGLAIADGATLDLTDNSMTVQGGDLAAINALVLSGRAGGTWAGTGITSSTAMTQSNRAVGIAIDGGGIRVGFTFAGDANLNGVVNIADLSLLATNWQRGVDDGNFAYWFHGDFNFDGKVTIADLSILANNWQAGVAAGESMMSFAEALAMFDVFNGVAIPEPASIPLAGLAGLLALRRRNLRKKRTCR